MSDEAKLFLLKEQIAKEKKNKRNAIIFLFTVCIVASLITPSELYWFGFILTVFTCTAISAYVIHYYDKQINQILLQIERLAYANKCPNCQKEIPNKEKFIYCPFCRAPLSSLRDAL